MLTYLPGRNNPSMYMHVYFVDRQTDRETGRLAIGGAKCRYKSKCIQIAPVRIYLRVVFKEELEWNKEGSNNRL